MKKLLLLMITGFFVSALWAKEPQRVDGYKVLSDKLDASIPKGSYMLVGLIYEIPSGKKIKGVSLQIVNDKEILSANGAFQQTIPVAKNYVAFRKKGYQVSYFEDYEIKDQHRIEVKIFMAKKGKEPEMREEKPVIYAYSDHKVQFDLLLKPKGRLTFTYPQPDANSAWHMTVDGSSLNDVKGNSYPYLFWEATQSRDFAFEHHNGKISGKILVRDEVTAYLDSVLSYMQFNSREKTDFITYWGPRLAENKYNLVQFVVQEDCSRFADYEVTPKPDMFNRFYLVYSGFDRYPGFIDVAPQDLKPFERRGFELLEWGGVCYPAYLDLTID